jgi:predicted component of type VI protein secretion system
MPTLTIQLPGLPLVSHVLKDDTITIGRMKGNTIVLDDDSVSLSHARITRVDGEFFLKDLNSTNGTIVNGQTVHEVKLKDQDRIRFADINGQFFADAAATQPAAPPINAPRLNDKATPPGPVPTAPPKEVPPKAVAPKPAAQPKPAPGFSQLANKVVPVIGAAAALGVFLVIGWRMLHVGNQEAAPAPDAVKAAPAISEPSRPAESREAQAPPPPADAPAPPPVGASATNNQIRPDVAQWIALLKAPDPAERRKAATALHSLGPDATEAVPALRAALEDTDPEVRMWAAVTLVNNKCYDKATIPILLEVLRNDNPVLRQVACLSLGIIPYSDAEKEAVVPLLKDCATKDAHEDVRKAAASALKVLAPQTP